MGAPPFVSNVSSPPSLPPSQVPPGAPVSCKAAQALSGAGEKVETLGEVMVKLWPSYGKLGLPKCLTEAHSTGRLNNSVTLESKCLSCRVLEKGELDVK